MRTIAGCADAKRQRIDWLSSECFNSIRREPLGVGKVKIMHSQDVGNTLGAPLRASILDRDTTTFNPVKFTQSPHESVCPFLLCRSRGRA